MKVFIILQSPVKNVRRIQVTVADKQLRAVDVPGSQLEIGPFPCENGNTVSVNVWDVDKNGILSAPPVNFVSVVDKETEPAHGEISFKIVV